MSEYELYHHGVKGQKWGVRRQEKKTARKQQRKERAGQAIDRAYGSKSSASLRRLGKGGLRYLGQNFIAGKAAATTMFMAMNAVNPSTAAIAFTATTAIALTNAGFNIQNVYKTGRDVYDIAKYDNVKHEDVSEFLAHHGIKGQRWGIRRFQYENGALTSLGKKRAEIDADWHPPKEI